MLISTYFTLSAGRNQREELGASAIRLIPWFALDDACGGAAPATRGGDSASFRGAGAAVLAAIAVAGVVAGSAWDHARRPQQLRDTRAAADDGRELQDDDSAARPAVGALAQHARSSDRG